MFQTEITPFIGTWLEVTEAITCGINGTYATQIKNTSDNSMLLDYYNANILATTVLSYSDLPQSS